MTKPTNMKSIAATCTLALILCTGPTVWAQKKTDKATVKWGPEMTVKENGQFETIVASRENSSFMIMSRKKERFLQRVDGTKVMWQKPLNVEMNKKPMLMENLALVGNDILVFASIYDKKANENQLYYSRYGTDQFKPLKVNEKMAVIPAPKSINTGSFEVRVSPGGNRVLVHQYLPVEKGELRKTLMEMYDGDMNLLWSQAMELPYNGNEFFVESQRVDDDGSVMLLGIKHAGGTEKRELKKAGLATYEYHLLVYDGQSPMPEDHLISVSDKFLKDMTVSLGKDGDVLCAGLYGNKGGDRAISGAFYLRLDRKSKKVVHESYRAFPSDFITSYMTEKQAAKAEKKAERKNEEMEMANYLLRDLVRRDDGGAVLLAEQYYSYVTYTTTSTGNGGTATTSTYHYVHNDIIVVNISPAGDIEWAVLVPKRQHSINTFIYNSFASAVKDDRIYLLFNDTGDNLFVKPGDKVKQFELTGKDALAVLVTIDAAGEVSREALFSPERRDVILRPADCEQLMDQSMFIYGSRKSDYRFGKIDFR